METGKMVRVSSKGQIVLPKALRDKMGVKEGDYLVAKELSRGVVVLATPSIAAFEELLEPLRAEVERRGITGEDVDRWIDEIRAERMSDAA